MKVYQFNRGYVSPQFAGSAPDGVIEYEYPTFLITDAALYDAEELAVMLEAFWEAADPSCAPIVVIAKTFGAQALAYLESKNAEGFPACAINAPGYGDRRKELLKDIAAVTGGFVCEATGPVGDRMIPAEMGHADAVKISAESTCIYGGTVLIKIVEQRMAQIRHEIETTQSDFDREKLQERLDALMGACS